MSTLTIVTYHYVRELAGSRYPEIKGLPVEDFRGQIAYLKRHYHPISGHDLLDAVEHKAKLPPRAVLLTFDDGYLDHFTEVLPVLEREGLSGCFFPPAQCVLENRVLDVNKIHFLLASISDKCVLVEAIARSVEQSQATLGLKPMDAYWQRFGRPSRYDPAEVAFIKSLLQRELPEAFRASLVGELFRKFVTTDEATFARELYMSVEQIRLLRQRGMYVGSHGYGHKWLNAMPMTEQRWEIDASLRFLESVGSDAQRWIMSYPYGGYDHALLGVLRERNCRVGLTIGVGIADLAVDAPLMLPRLDTNDLPKAGAAPPGEWTRLAE